MPKDYAREEAGSQIIMASCVDDRYPPENMLDGKEGSFWITTGCYPQVSHGGDHVMGHGGQQGRDGGEEEVTGGAGKEGSFWMPVWGEGRRGGREGGRRHGDSHHAKSYQRQPTNCMSREAWGRRGRGGEMCVCHAGAILCMPCVCMPCVSVCVCARLLHIHCRNLCSSWPSRCRSPRSSSCASTVRWPNEGRGCEGGRHMKGKWGRDTYRHSDTERNSAQPACECHSLNH